MADCSRRDRRTSERVERGGQEALSGLGRVCGGRVKSSRFCRCIGFPEGAVNGCSSTYTMSESELPRKIQGRWYFKTQTTKVSIQKGFRSPLCL